MRTITLQHGQHVELWPGRRLFIDHPNHPMLFSIPRTGATARFNSVNASITFGSVTKVSLCIAGPLDMIRQLWTYVVALDQPPTETIKTLSASYT